MFLRICLALLFILVSACSERRPSPSKEKSPNDKKAETEKEKRGPTNVSKRIGGAFSSQVAGSFYPGDEKELRSMVEKYVSEASFKGLREKSDLVGILSPHAGYIYSGKVAGEAYALLKERDYKTVVVMALNHRQMRSKVSVLDMAAYDTPLGSLKINRSYTKELLKNYSDLFESDESAFSNEHSLEVQLPFIQVVKPKATIVPIVVAVRDQELIGKAGKALFEVFGKKKDVVFVASTDFSHHFPYEQAKKYDENNLKLLENWSIDEWIESASLSREGMCGVKPVLTLVRMFEQFSEKRRSVTRIKYLNSGDTAGDKQRVVGYGALAFSVEKGMRNEETSLKDFGPYGSTERKALMSLAKKAVEAAAKGDSFAPEEPSTALSTIALYM